MRSNQKEKYRRACKCHLGIPPPVSLVEYWHRVNFLKNFFSQEDAESLVGDYMKHRQHLRGKPLADGSGSPGCMKVGDAHVPNLTSILLYLPHCCSGQQQCSEMSYLTCFSGVSEDAKRSLR